MADYRLILSLIVQGYSYRQIEAMASCSHRAIAKAHTIAKAQSLTTTDQVDASIGGLDVDLAFTTVTDLDHPLYYRSTTTALNASQRLAHWHGGYKRLGEKKRKGYPTLRHA